jgi:hypothetical protein
VSSLGCGVDGVGHVRKEEKERWANFGGCRLGLG